MSRRRTLGEILVQLGFVSKKDLEQLQADLTQATKEEKWGNQLIARGVISQKQLERAMELMGDLGCEDKEKRGMAASELVEAQTGSVVNLADRIAIKAANIKESAIQRRAETGQDHPVITPALLEES